MAIEPMPMSAAPSPPILPAPLQHALEDAGAAGAPMSHQATTALLASMLRLQEELGSGLVIIDADSRPVYGSPAFLRMVGLELGDFLALRSVADVFAENRRPDVEDRRLRRKRGEIVPITYESRLLRRDGAPIDVELSSLPLRIGDRQLFLKLLRDVTRRKQTQRLARVGTWDWILATDQVQASDETWSILGKRPPGRPTQSAGLWSGFHPEDRTPTLNALQTARTEAGPFTLDYRLVRPDGTTRFLHVEGSSAVGPSGGEMSGSIQDVTDLRFAEQSLQALTRDLMRSNDELEQFAYVASHDLREPLRIISGYLGILERRYSKQLPPDAQGLVTAAVEGAARMEQLIFHLLEYSRVGTHGGDLLPMASEDALAEAVRNLQLGIDETNAEVSHGPLPIVVADRAQLAQLFQNCVGNAIKFRRAEPPRIRVTAQRLAKEWRFSIQDNGIGIDEKDYDRVFELFQRLHSAQEYPGSGIGLAVAKKIVERHGGRIWVGSKPGEGSTFHFTLPVPE